MAKKLARGKFSGSGARACLGPFTLEKSLAAPDGYAIRTRLDAVAPMHGPHGYRKR
ncbi:hypothetical protein [Luteimonas salinilitoris]|uniref:Uncharacterized protein n=1 Tax=Luteimonas salinilitoris TaxID=3237697 RepID=A0ABV4HPU5_9GAMM